MLDIARKPKRAHVWDHPALDWYVEPVRVSAALLDAERFEGLTWDPSCGQGNICRALLAAGVPTVGTDLVRRAARREPWWGGRRDFLDDETWLRGALNVMTNPPYYRSKGTEAFARKALRHAKGKVAIFTDLRFLASGRRARGLYAEHPPHRIWILADRPSCPPGTYLQAGNEAKNGSADFCWLVWDLRSDAPKTSHFGWLTERGAE